MNYPHFAPDPEIAWRLSWRRAARPLLAAALLSGLVAAPLASAEPDEGKALVSGRVLEGEVRPTSPEGERMPLARAQVYAYEVASLKLVQALTDGEGRFAFERLPAGLYKIVAYKAGFVPAVELLLRRRSDVRQDVELRLREEQPSDLRQAESYWDARSRIPADVLRHIDLAGFREGSPDTGLTVPKGSLFTAEMVAEGGTTDLGLVEAQVARAAVDLRGSIGATALGFDGRYQQLTPEGEAAPGLPGGEVRTMALYLENERDDKLSLLSSTGQMANLAADGFAPVDMRHYQLRWTGPTGNGATTDFLAQFATESNYHRGLGIEPADVPEGSQTWSFRGSYQRDVGTATSVTTGVSYRQRETTDPSAMLYGGEEVSVYGLAGSQIQPRVLIEYGLYSSVNDGGLSLTPHGGMVVQLGESWSARTAFSQRVEERAAENQPYRDFNTAFYGDGTSCQEVGESCYEVTFTHGTKDEEEFFVGAIHREYAETLKVYFNDDFFHRLESLLVVPGDEIPEVKFRLVRHLAPRVLAKLESNFASGGGGIFYATDEKAYENEVRYLVTSLDTRFQQTQTGVFVAFHHLEQALTPQNGEAASGLEMQRLQLMLTQDLSALANLASSWALRLNMEVSRGSNPYTLTPDNDLYKKLTGGITVSF